MRGNTRPCHPAAPHGTTEGATLARRPRQDARRMSSELEAIHHAVLGGTASSQQLLQVKEMPCARATAVIASEQRLKLTTEDVRPKGWPGIK